MLTEYQRYRLYEILPGLSIWLTLIVAVILAFVKPLWMIYFVIVFDVYWMLKVLNFSFYLIVAWRRYAAARKIHWKDKLFHEVPNWQEKKHIIFLTLYNESWEVVESSIQSIVDAVYDKQNFIIVVAGEARTRTHYDDILQKVEQKYASKFYKVIGTCHPMNLKGEIPGKGSNLNYSERQVQHYVDKQGWHYEDVIATVFDIDTVCHKDYFAYLGYLYCTHPNPTRTSYQPIALYNNNMWESPSVLRIMAFGTTFWMFTSLARQDALVTFSSHSISFKALVDVGFHEKRIVSEDSRIFYQCYLHYNGEYEVTPMYVPVSMDTVRDDSWGQSMKNLYKQQRRWAWGVEHVPYLLTEFRKKKKEIAWWKRAKWVFIEWEGKWSWCVVAILITVLGWVPIKFGGEALQQTAFFFNAPHILSRLMTISMIGLFLSAILSFPLLPKKPKSHPDHQYVVMLLQWVLLPISMILMSAIPAIDAVTHLMFGKYLGFNVSQKKRG
jgi:hypothetical protein